MHKSRQINRRLTEEGGGGKSVRRNSRKEDSSRASLERDLTPPVHIGYAQSTSKSISRVDLSWKVFQASFRAQPHHPQRKVCMYVLRIN